MKIFDVPEFYRSPLISAIKKQRKGVDTLKKDFSPTLLDFGPIQIYLARHFGFCYGVENAIEIAFKTVQQNPGKRIFLLSEMIHNPEVNKDLKSYGVQFLQNTHGKELIPFDTLTSEDIVLIPAFGATLEIEKKLQDIGIETGQYNTTCPFVEKVWNRSSAIAKKDYTIIIHGKPTHEETRATFSHAASEAAAVVVKNMAQTRELAQFITGERPAAEFYEAFKGQYSAGFDVTKNLQKIGVVNQTTMLASDTQGIADFLKNVMIEHYNLTKETLHERFADTRDTLCYATNDNQTAVSTMLETDAHLAIVVGGYNSSNTSHLVELCEEKIPTYFVNGADKLVDGTTIVHYDFHLKEEKLTHHYLPDSKPVKILITSGASCPDALVEQVIEKVLGFYPESRSINAVAEQFR